MPITPVDIWAIPLAMNFSTDELAGYVACALVLATFAMRSMRRLRLVAILSNIAFIYYAGVLGLLPILVLHSILLPLNVWRCIELHTESSTASPSHVDRAEYTTSPKISPRNSKHPASTSASKPPTAPIWAMKAIMA